MTNSQIHLDKVEQLRKELAQTIQESKQARKLELAQQRASQEEEYNTKLEEAINTYCDNVEEFKKDHPQTFDMALAYAKEVASGENVENVAQELNSIMGIVDMALTEL